MANKEVRCDDDETKHSQLHAVLENAREIVVSVYDDTSGRAILFQQISYIVLSIAYNVTRQNFFRNCSSEASN